MSADSSNGDDTPRVTIPLETNRLHRHFLAALRTQLRVIAESVTTETRADEHSSLLALPGQLELRRGVRWTSPVGSISMTTSAVEMGTVGTRHVHAGRGLVASVQPRVGITARTSWAMRRSQHLDRLIVGATGRKGIIERKGITGRKSVGWENQSGQKPKSSLDEMHYGGDGRA